MPTSEPFVALIDDDEAVLDSLRLYLLNKGFSVAPFLTAEAFLAWIDVQRPPDCIVSDVRLPGLSGLQLQEELTRRRLKAPLLLITGHGDIEMAVTAIKAGAYDFLEKPFREERLLVSIRTALASAAEQRDKAEELADLARRKSDLTDRQRQVMDFATNGYTNREIGRALQISPRTVEIYRSQAMEKMGVGSLAELVRVAVLLADHEGGAKGRS